MFVGCDLVTPWDELSETDRRGWEAMAARAPRVTADPEHGRLVRPMLTWPQRLVCWAAMWVVGAAALLGIVTGVAYLVSRW